MPLANPVIVNGANPFWIKEPAPLYKNTLSTLPQSAVGHCIDAPITKGFLQSSPVIKITVSFVQSIFVDFFVAGVPK